MGLFFSVALFWCRFRRRLITFGSTFNFQYTGLVDTSSRKVITITSLASRAPDVDDLNMYVVVEAAVTEAGLGGIEFEVWHFGQLTSSGSELYAS